MDEKNIFIHHKSQLSVKNKSSVSLEENSENLAHHEHLSLLHSDKSTIIPTFALTSENSENGNDYTNLLLMKEIAILPQINFEDKQNLNCASFEHYSSDSARLQMRPSTIGYNNLTECNLSPCSALNLLSKSAESLADPNFQTSSPKYQRTSRTPESPLPSVRRVRLFDPLHQNAYSNEKKNTPEQVDRTSSSTPEPKSDKSTKDDKLSTNKLAKIFVSVRRSRSTNSHSTLPKSAILVRKTVFF